MPKYMLILRGDITQDYSQWTPEQMQGVIQKYADWAGKIAAQGRLHLGRKLTDEGGRVLKPAQGGKSFTVKDGPYVESKEVVGGVYLISADSYDQAVEMCKGHPNFLFGSIEVRELDFMGQPEE